MDKTPEFKIDPVMEAATRAAFATGDFINTEQYLQEIKDRDVPGNHAAG